MKNKFLKIDNKYIRIQDIIEVSVNHNHHPSDGLCSDHYNITIKTKYDNYVVNSPFDGYTDMIDNANKIVKEIEKAIK